MLFVEVEGINRHPAVLIEICKGLAAVLASVRVCWSLGARMNMGIEL